MDFVILKVNGKDVSRCSHDEAVAAFQSAREPIVVEVLRRVSSDGSPMKSRSPPRAPSPVMADAVTQTDEFIENSYFDLFHANGYPLGSMVQSPNGLPFPPPSELGLTDLDISNGMDYDAEFDPERAFDMEYEEVTLHRQGSEQKVGLTLCYGSADDEITDIFVGEIESGSIAAEDGRIREGDQILQINSEDVRTREEAIKLFSENRSDITLLLSRQIVQVDDGFMDERATFDDLQVLQQHRLHQHKLELTSAMLAQDRHLDEDCGTTDTATTECSQKHEKDSGVGKTDGDSTRNDESSEQEMIENEMSSPMNCNDHHYSNESFTSNDLGVNDIPAEECQKFREVLETRCSSASDASPSRRTQRTPRKDSQSSIEREIAALNQEMEQIQLQCQEIVDTHSKEQQRVGKQSEMLRSAEPGFRSPRMVPRMGTRLDHLKQPQGGQVASAQECEPPLWVRQEHLARVANQVHRDAMVAADHNRNTKQEESKESNSSAYNTGESMRSTPLTFELHNDQNASMLSLNARAATEDRASTIYDEDLYAEIPCVVAQSQSTLSVSRMSQTEEDAAKESLHELYTQYADVMYTNRANLQHTIMVQQKLFQQQLMQRARSRQQQQQQQEHQQQRKSKGARKNDESPHSRSSSSSKGKPADKSRSNSGNRSASSGEQEGVKNEDSASGMEWVVKRRADGSRYITRRPVRNRLLKERAKKLNEERCGLTTDDDAMSELKVGRYWNKEDRKRHLEKSRDRKTKKEAMLRQRMETVKEAEEVGRKEPNIVELSHRKMMRHKNKKVLDDFTTIHEMLAHGAREQNPKATYNPLLSVTTV